MTKQAIPYARQWVTQDDIHGVCKILESNFLTTGPLIDRFENRLCELTQAKHAIVCTNGTAALHLACMALGMSDNDLGVTSANSFLASANCIEFCGARTDFIDIDADSLCMSPENLETYCREKQIPRVVIPVDFAGIAADLPRFKALSQKFGFSIIEDAAHAIGSTYTFKGKTFKCGSCTHSDMAIFSFHPAKTITTGEGGAVLTNDDDLADKLRTLRTHGMIRNQNQDQAPDQDQHQDRNQDQDNIWDDPWYYEMKTLGYNYRITDFQCALGLSQLDRLSQFKTRRNQIVSLYNQAFQDNNQLIIPPEKMTNEACPHLYPIQLTKGKDARRAMYHALKHHNIHCQIHYIPIYWQPYYANKYGYAKGKCPRAENYYQRTLSLPLYPAMTDAKVQKVIKAVLANL
ncbi:MAG: UDP-4-amino-4,6-dideoxy-N-acetyl-beta-L-altrosamine transaminase [Desulfobacteraceae bacterium]|nr:UDP-4-amino-4,6-dideoxy-N-acetyl-beta-L-altrosamine transaminase [Desulfobacteraceae bacterium]